MSTYLVTGAAGFIASKVCEMLLAEGHTVVGVDNLNDYYDVRLKDYRLSRLLGDGRWEMGDGVFKLGTNPRVSVYASGPNSQLPTSISATAGRFVFQTVDIENLGALEALFDAYRFDAVFNLAGRAGVRYSMEHPHVYLSTNTLGTLNLLECQRKYGVKKHVLASSSSLYAGCPMPFTEDQPVNTPQSPYAATKKAAELMAYTYHQLYGLDVTVLRYFTVFGPAGRPDMAPLRFIKWIDEGTPIKLFGDGTQARDFTYIDDIARGTILAAKLLVPRPEGGELKPEGLNPVDSGRFASRSDGQPLTDSVRPPVSDFKSQPSVPPGYEIINLGGGRNPTTLREVIAIIEQALGKKALIDPQPANPADLRETQADITKAKRLLGWEADISAEEGFRKTVRWHLANRSLMQGIGL